MDIIIVIFFSYLCGSIPFGLILTKIFAGQDVRCIGSGNIGATNVLRTGNKSLAFLTLILDMLKGYFPIMITKYFFPELFHVSALLAFLGNIFPIWLKFKGGKGVATFLGITVALSYSLALLFILTWITTTLIFKYSSLSSIFACLTVLIINSLRELAYTINITVMSSQVIDSKILFIFFILIIFTHRKNVSNLKNNTEEKIKI